MNPLALAICFLDRTCANPNARTGPRPKLAPVRLLHPLRYANFLPLRAHCSLAETAEPLNAKLNKRADEIAADLLARLNLKS